jgi:hypothetical protein
VLVLALTLSGSLTSSAGAAGFGGPGRDAEVASWSAWEPLAELWERFLDRIVNAVAKESAGTECDKGSSIDPNGACIALVDPDGSTDPF